MPNDILKLHADHAKAMVNARKHAEKGIELAQAGKVKAARVAERKAAEWLRKARDIEERLAEP